MLHFRGGRAGVDSVAYPEMEQFFTDAIAVYRAEIMELAAAGCRYVQLDDTNLAYLCDTRLRERVRSARRGSGSTAASLCATDQRRDPDRPADMKITVHLCRGNSLSRGHAEGGYEPVAEAMFNEVKIDGFFLEYDDARSAISRRCASCRKASSGSCSAWSPRNSVRSSRKTRSSAASRKPANTCPSSRCASSPQCGFASHTGGNLLSEDEQYAKLRHVVELAQEIWPDAR